MYQPSYIGATQFALSFHKLEPHVTIHQTPSVGKKRFNVRAAGNWFCSHIFFFFPKQSAI